MGPHLASLIALFVAVFILMSGNGLLTTLVPLRGTAEGFTPEAIGLIGSTYFFGMLCGTWATPGIVRRAGHIRAFAAYAAISATAALGFAVAIDPFAWMGLRGLIGFCFAGLFSIIDSWINSKASNANRGRMLAMSNVVNFSGGATGQQILQLDSPKSFTLFSAVAGLFMIGLVPIALTTAEPPPPPPKGRLDTMALYRATPIGVVGMILVGLINATFWSLAVVYVEHLGLGVTVVSGFMTAVIIGSAIGPYPIARLSDKLDRRLVIIAVAVLCAVTEVGLIVAGAANPWLLYALAFTLGLGLPTIYPLISAHTNDRAGREGMVTVASTLLFIYCCGAIVGPSIAAFFMARFGDPVMFAGLAVLHLSLASFVGLRMLSRGPAEERVEAVIDAPEVPAGPKIR